MATSKCSFPRPEPGDVFQRYTTTGLLEKAMVTSVVGPPGEPRVWKAILFTANGHEQVGSDPEYRGRLDWAPKGWSFDERGNCWVEPASSVEIVPPYKGEHHLTWRKRALESSEALRMASNAEDLLSAAWKSMDKVDAPETSAIA